MNGTRRITTQRLLASLTMLLLGIGAALIGFAGTAGSASAAEGDEECVPSPGTSASYTPWTDEGGLLRTEENAAPAANTETEQYVSRGQTAPEVITPASAGFWTNFEPNDKQATYVGPPSYPNDTDGTWSDKKVEGGPDKAKSGVFQSGVGNGSWFYRELPKAAVTDTDFLWQKQVRTFVPATNPVVCDEPTILPTEGTNPTEPTDPTDPPDPTKCPEGTTNVGLDIPEGVDWNVWCAEVLGTDGSNPTDPANPGGGDPSNDPEVKGGGDGVVEPTVLGVEAHAPAAAAPAAAAPTAVDAGLAGGTESDSSSTLWILAGAAFALAGLVMGFAPTTARGKRAL